MRLFLLVMTFAAGVAAQPYRPAEENLKARQWFQDARFGLFVHWGVYSVLEQGEWVMENRKISIADYEPHARRFNPTEFDPAEWVALVKRAGMKYITITTKHHEGFAMWRTQQTDWNIVDRTPWKKDPMKMLADECHRQGIKLIFYYSELDWHHPDFYPLGRSGHSAGRPERGDWNRYLDFMDAQLRELLTGYGEILGICFDGWWDKPDADWRLRKTYDLIHSLQPAALITNNHHHQPFDGEDYQIFEQDLPGHRTQGFNKDQVVGKLPLETAITMNSPSSWGYNKNDKRFKSTKELIHYLVRAAGANANFDLNVGPMPNGKIQPESVERLEQIGDWMRRNGATIYGTRGGPVPPRNWGAITAKGNKLYVHVLDWDDELLALPSLPPIASARLFGTGQKVDLITVAGGHVLRLPAALRNDVDTIVELEEK